MEFDEVVTVFELVFKYGGANKDQSLELIDYGALISITNDIYFGPYLQTE